MTLNYREIKTLQDKVEYCLREYPKTRNSDVRLTTTIWEKFYSNYIFADHIGRPAVALYHLFELPREDNVKRIRAKFNHKGLYLPTVWEIAEKRGILENEWRVAMGYPTKKHAENDRPSWTPPSEMQDGQNKLL